MQKYAPLNLTRDELIEYTQEWTGERSEEGRPRVPDSILERMRQVTITEAWQVLFNEGYQWQYTDGWRCTHPDRVLVGRALTAMYPRAADDIGGAVAEYRRRLRSCDDEASKLAAASSAHLMTLRAALQGHPRVAVLRPALDMAARKMEARKAMAPGSLQEAIAADLASVELLAATIAVGPGSFMFETAVRGVLSDLAAADVEMPDPLSQFGTSRAALFRMLWIFTVQGQEMGSVSELNADQRRDMR